MINGVFYHRFLISSLRPRYRHEARHLCHWIYCVYRQIFSISVLKHETYTVDKTLRLLVVIVFMFFFVIVIVYCYVWELHTLLLFFVNVKCNVNTENLSICTRKKCILWGNIKKYKAKLSPELVSQITQDWWSTVLSNSNSNM